MIYYLETNLIAIIIALVLYYQNRKTTSKMETSRLIFDSMLLALILFSISDIGAYISRGKSYWGVEIFNMAYFFLNCFGAYLWSLYFFVKLDFTKNLRRSIILTAIPLFVLSVIIFSNPIFHLAFTVDKMNLYHRGPAMPIIWIMQWSYMIFALIITYKRIKSSTSSLKRKEYTGYLVFVVPIIVSCGVQMAFYGTTCTQIGFGIALIMVYLNSQHHHIHRDELTGLNNTVAFYTMKESILLHNKEPMLTIFMIDVDKFKSINDTYGHLIGDVALRNVAKILRDSVSNNQNLSLFRYAGDEFVVIGLDLKEGSIKEFVQKVRNQLKIENEINHKNNIEYTLSLSIGYATGLCTNAKEFDLIFKSADENMYTVKKGK